MAQSPSANWAQRQRLQHASVNFKPACDAGAGTQRVQASGRCGLQGRCSWNCLGSGCALCGAEQTVIQHPHTKVVPRSGGFVPRRVLWPESVWSGAACVLLWDRARQLGLCVCRFGPLFVVGLLVCWFFFFPQMRPKMGNKAVRSKYQTNSEPN